MLNLWLFGTFAKFSLMLFGGGYMIVPFLMQTFVEEEHILTLDTFGNLMAIAQMTPGAISMNSSTYIGYIENGWSGAISASLGLIFPTVFLGLLAGTLLNKWKNTAVLEGVLRGARLAALGMVIYACLIFMDMSVFSLPVPWQQIADSILSLRWTINSDFYIQPLELVITISACILMLRTKISIVPLLMSAGCLGAFMTII